MSNNLLNWEPVERSQCTAAAALAGSRTIPPAALAAHRALAATEDFTPHDIAFHRSLVEGQPSSRLVRMHSILAGEIELCIGQVQAARAARDRILARLEDQTNG